MSRARGHNVTRSMNEVWVGAKVSQNQRGRADDISSRGVSNMDPSYRRGKLKVGQSKKQGGPKDCTVLRQGVKWSSGCEDPSHGGQKTKNVGNFRRTFCLLKI